MIYRGIVEEILNPFTIKVRIPLIHRIKNSTQHVVNKSLPEASICTLARSHPNLCIGDVVVVGFEANDLSKPIILGHLYKESFDNSAESIELNDLNVISETHLSKNTSIGDVSSFELAQLHGVRDNLQNQIDILVSKIQKLEEKLNI
jgi:hypothetical protein